MSEPNTGYFRSPSIAGDTVAFVCEDDVWSVPSIGGIARRLTANLGPVGRAVISRDGEWLAFTGSEELHAEVYVMPALGGPATRLTYLGANTAVRGWTPDGRILFVTDAGRPHQGDFHLFTIAPDGGDATPVDVGPATEATFEPDGDGSVLGRHTIDPARWKRYRGGRRGDVWIDRSGSGEFKRLFKLEGNFATPLWVGKRIYFISDHEGIGNLYSCTPTGRGIQRHSDHDTYYARWASTDGQSIVYQHAAEVWIYRPGAEASERIDIDLRSPRTQRNRRFVETSRFLHYVAPHPTGLSIALSSRGKLHTMPLWEHAARQFGRRDGVRYRLPRWTADGKQLVCISDDGGLEAVEVHDAEAGTLVRRLDGLDIGRPITMAPSPTTDEVAITTHRNELLLVNHRTRRLTVLDRSSHERIRGASWSPDGRYIAYGFPDTARTSQIRLVETATGKVTDLTRSDFNDYAPAFDPEGRFLYFLSSRVFDPVMNVRFFDYGFPRTIRPHLITLKADAPSPFIPEPRGFGPPAPDDAGKKPAAKGTSARAGKPTEIDLDGIQDRVLAFPVPEGRYTQVDATKDKVFFTSYPVSGSLGDDIFEDDDQPRGKIDVYDLRELKLEPLVGGVNGFALSQDRSTMIYMAGRRLRALKAGDKPNPKHDKDPPSRRSGWVDLKRVRISVDPSAEYPQMFTEAWRFQKDHFWVDDLSDVDWDAIHARYRPLVDKVATRSEFSDLMWETLGELGTSHAYEMGGDHRPPPRYPIGQLAADVELRGSRWVISHIVRGDSWDPLQTSPLAAPGVNAREGQTILAVNGQPTSPESSPMALLVNQAGALVELTLGNAQGRSPRTVIVRALPTQVPARYREWVETNRALVHDRTNGRVGYVHIPDMGADGYSEFHRYYQAEVVRDGLIIDVRHNGGGHVSQIILEKLARKRVGYDWQRWGEPEPYPSDSPSGPLVCLTDESAGSDGDIFSHVFKLLDLGPVVGKRTWGGVIGINMRHRLVDNGLTTQPEFSFWFHDVGWSVENYGTDPTHDVDITPQDHRAGRDPQMDTALQLIDKALADHRPVRPDLSTKPSLALPVLPNRDGSPGTPPDPLPATAPKPKPPARTKGAAKRKPAKGKPAKRKPQTKRKPAKRKPAKRKPAKRKPTRRR